VVRLWRAVKSYFWLDPAPHDKFDEWPVSAGQFLHQYHVKHVDLSKLTECDPCALMVDGECIFMLDGQRMTDGLQHLAMKQGESDTYG